MKPDKLYLAILRNSNEIDFVETKYVSDLILNEAYAVCIMAEFAKKIFIFDIAKLDPENKTVLFQDSSFEIYIETKNKKERRELDPINLLALLIEYFEIDGEIYDHYDIILEIVARRIIEEFKNQYKAKLN